MIRATPKSRTSMAIELPRALSSRISQYDAKITPYVLFTCIMAASGGLMYGYDLVIAGGISIMDDFLLKFYPGVHRSKFSSTEDIYCKYNNQELQLFTSSLYLAAVLATFFANMVSRKYGRRATMLMAGIFFIVGTVLGTSAQNLVTLIMGRAVLGCGVGFANQAVPVYLSEIAPPSLRGGLNLLFVVYALVGELAGNIINYLVQKINQPWGWRLSLGCAGVPALILTICSLLVVETPSSLLERGHFEQTKKVLRRIRGREDVDAEFEDLFQASKEAQGKGNSFRELFSRSNRPQLVVACALPFFQQVAGNDAILFYGPFLFKTAGFGDSAALYSSVITGATGFVACCAAVFIVDVVGRRRLLLLGSIFMCAPLVVIASLFGAKLQGGTKELGRGEGEAQVVMVCMFVAAFMMSLGPLAWLVPSEVYAQEVRSSGQSLTVGVNMLFKFVIAQTFLSMLCAFKFAIFLFFAGWVLVMGVFTLLLLPETKGLPLHKMPPLWESHWFWRHWSRLPT